MATNREASEPAPPAPEEAVEVFGAELDRVRRYAEMLADTGVLRGLLGPREVPRLWERHLLNCGVLAPELPDRASVVDVGTGAGLPGVLLAILRPDVSVTLLEPLLRRTTFLSEVVDDLGVGNATVLRARAEDGRKASRSAGVGDSSGRYRVVVARAVARLEKLAGLTLPLCASGGEVIAMKGASAEDEVEAAARRLPSLGAADWSVEQYGVGVLKEPTTVVRIVARPGRGTG